MIAPWWPGCSGLGRRVRSSASLLLLLAACYHEPPPVTFSPALLYDAWVYAYACASHDSLGNERDTSAVGGFHRVVVRVVPKLKGGILGQWQFSRGHAPDTITVVRRWADSAWVWRHELAHHVLHDTTVSGPDHPNFPFTFPCRLQVYQNLNPQAGIMGPRPTP